jgi:6-phosphogluconolactonase
MTLTYPMINRSRNNLWIVTGAEKVAMLKRLQAKDTTIPAGRICQDKALILADRKAVTDIMAK